MDPRSVGLDNDKLHDGSVLDILHFGRKDYHSDMDSHIHDFGKSPFEGSHYHLCIQYPWMELNMEN